MTRPHFKAVFLSPHLDDVVYSCAGELSRLGRVGDVCVINIFTKYLDSAVDSPVPLDQGRYDEENHAARLFGYQSIRLEFLDLFFRDPRFKHMGHIFKPVLPKDRSIVPDLKQRLEDVLRTMTFDYLYIPLGIGWHIDHMLCHEIGIELCEYSKIIFYEDAPYCLINGATAARLSQLKGEKFSFWKIWFRVVQSFWSQGMYTISMRSFVVRLLAYPAVMGYFGVLLRAQNRDRVQNPLKLTPLLVDVSADIHQKWAGVWVYKSQTAHFFEDISDTIRKYTDYSREISGGQEYTERYWMMKSGI